MRGMMPARATPRAGATSRAVVRGRSSAFATSRRGRGSGRSARATRVGDGERGRAVIGLVARGRSVVASRARWSTTTTVKAREWLGRASLSGTTTARAAATIATTKASEDEESENAYFKAGDTSLDGKIPPPPRTSNLTDVLPYLFAVSLSRRGTAWRSPPPPSCGADIVQGGGRSLHDGGGGEWGDGGRGGARGGDGVGGERSAQGDERRRDGTADSVFHSCGAGERKTSGARSV